MRSLLLLAVLAVPAWSAGARPAPSAAAPFRPGTVRWTAVGRSLVDTRAPGAPLLLRGLEYTPEPKPVLGLFDREKKEVVNAFVIGEFGVLGHKDAIPPGADEKKLGGYVFALGPAGEPQFAGSGHFRNGVTPPVERALLRYFGVLPQREGWIAWGLRHLLNAWDAVSRVFFRV